ncbi:MAG: hypothetical protein GKR94_00995 [Gammaproteobacteria bacterium]|nr:hypothetical protein [Gammaproteobacteria bacterium]
MGIRPSAPDGQPGPGYQAWLKDEIAAGIAQLDAGPSIPAPRVWQDLGLE